MTENLVEEAGIGRNVAVVRFAAIAYQGWPDIASLPDVATTFHTLVENFQLSSEFPISQFVPRSKQGTHPFTASGSSKLVAKSIPGLPMVELPPTQIRSRPLLQVVRSSSMQRRPASLTGDLRPCRFRASGSRAVSVSTRRLQRSLQRLASRHRKHMRVGIQVLHLKSGEKCSVGGRKVFPLASVAKLPILAEAMLHLQNTKAGNGGVKLNSPILVNEDDKCIGSGQLWKLTSGATIEFGECLDLMVTVSDNTAADLVLKTVTLEKVRKLMKDLHLKTTNICLSQRQAFLLAMGKAPQLAGMSSRQIVNKWKEWTVEEQMAVAAVTDEANCGLEFGDFSAMERDAEKLQQVQGSHSWREDVALAATVDNSGSPSDICYLLSLLARGELLSPHSTQHCLSILLKQKCGTRRLPSYLPEGTPVYHKTGTVLGVVNDAGIIEIGGPQNQAVVVAFIDQIDRCFEREAEAVIARTGQMVYKAYYQKI